MEKIECSIQNVGTEYVTDRKSSVADNNGSEKRSVSCMK